MNIRGRTWLAFGVVLLVVACSATNDRSAPRSSAPAGSQARLPPPEGSLAASSGHGIRTSGCLYLFDIELVNDQVPAEVFWQDCYGSLPTIPAGVSTWDIPISASYKFCGMSSGPRRCVHGYPPPLPPGFYQATLFQVGSTHFPAPATVGVRVTPAAAGAPWLRQH